MKSLILKYIIPIGLILFINIKYIGNFHCRLVGIVLSPICIAIFYALFYLIPSIFKFKISKNKNGSKPFLFERLSPCALALIIVVVTSAGMRGTPALALFNSYYIAGILYNLGREICV